MRILLAGPQAARSRLKEQLQKPSFDVAGEYTSVAAARASGMEADGILIAMPDVGFGTRDAGEPEMLEEQLTPREVEVLQLLAEGLSNKGIAERLEISDQTVKFHVSSVIAKVGAANRTDAVRRGVRRGLISL